jgi:hypothetical protein
MTMAETPDGRFMMDGSASGHYSHTFRSSLRSVNESRMGKGFTRQ